MALWTCEPPNRPFRKAQPASRAFETNDIFYYCRAPRSRIPAALTWTPSQTKGHISSQSSDFQGSVVSKTKQSWLLQYWNPSTSSHRVLTAASNKKLVTSLPGRLVLIFFLCVCGFLPQIRMWCPSSRLGLGMDTCTSVTCTWPHTAILRGRMTRFQEAWSAETRGLASRFHSCSWAFPRTSTLAGRRAPHEHVCTRVWTASHAVPTEARRPGRVAGLLQACSARHWRFQPPWLFSHSLYWRKPKGFLEISINLDATRKRKYLGLTVMSWHRLILSL